MKCHLSRLYWFTSNKESVPNSSTKSIEQSPYDCSKPAAPTPKKNLEQQSDAPKNQGKLILDATCAPADISYPTDLKLLNQARVHSEKIIDILYEPLKEKSNWDNFNESGDFKAQIEAYRNFTGYYPESVHVDKIYRTLLEPSLV